MPSLKCKMCGGDLVITPDSTVCECEYCGSKQTIPVVDDEKKIKLYERANKLRYNCDFDKAASVYENIIADFPDEAEAYWGLLLCKFGIEYVDSPDGRKVPTCHRSSFDCVLDDPDFEMVMENADSAACDVYRAQAKEIEAIRKGIIEVSGREAPYDIFICYKETAEDGQRTLDSVLAQDIYDALTAKGYRVFFSRVTLEDKLGTEYEPYIFAALNSAKLMLAFGTSYQYYNAVWVKNEWSRYLKLMAQDKTKHLIPCYKDIDAYDMPKEFARLQAQDLGKVGATQDLLRGIEKILGSKQEQPAAQPAQTVIVQQSGGTTAAAQVERGNMALEDGDWAKADGFFEEALNLDPKCAEAYLGKLLAKDKQHDFASWVTMQKGRYSAETTERLDACPTDTAHISKMVAECAVPGYLDEETILDLYEYDRGYDSALSCRKSQKAKQQRDLDAERHLVRARQYAQGSVQKRIEDGISAIMAASEQCIKQAQDEDHTSIERVKSAYAGKISEADKRAEALNADAQKSREEDYQTAVMVMDGASDAASYERAIKALNDLNGYKDSKDLIKQCENEIERLKEEARQEKDRQAAIARKKAEQAKHKARIIAAITIPSAAVVIAFLIVLFTVIIPNQKYNAAVELMESGEYDEAIAAFESMDGYKNSIDWIYNSAVKLMESGEYDEAIAAFEELDGYKDSASLISEMKSEIQHTPEMWSGLEAGDHVYFGSYNGDEIEWRILDKTDDAILLISEYGLDAQPYNTEYENVTWQTCTLRSWLNDDFYNAAFSSEEQAMIQTTSVVNNDNPVYGTNGGNDTQDKMFLLSLDEAEEYFSNYDDRVCYTVGGADTWWWWLRSPGGNSNRAACVHSVGSLYSYGSLVHDGFGYVRPAFWLNLDS